MGERQMIPKPRLDALTDDKDAEQYVRHRVGLLTLIAVSVLAVVLSIVIPK